MSILVANEILGKLKLTLEIARESGLGWDFKEFMVAKGHGKGGGDFGAEVYLEFIF